MFSNLESLKKDLRRDMTLPTHFCTACWDGVNDKDLSRFGPSPVILAGRSGFGARIAGQLGQMQSGQRHRVEQTRQGRLG